MEAKAAVLLLAALQLVSSEGIQTTSGALSGIQVNVEDKVVDAYLGVPYAKPPVDDLRFKKPQPVEPWQGVYEANKKSPPCMQVVGPSLVETLTSEPSEDCLFLNLWVPKSGSSEDPELLKPIMVWIFPGAFFSGSSSLDSYDGKEMAAYGDVIVASMDYRLGVFGFLYSNNEEGPGNMGLLDQNLALKWIKDNAQAFGGDPNKITIFGESSGALSVGMHLLSPLSQGLFTRALLQGRSPLYTYSKQSPNTGVPLTKDFAQVVGCGAEDIGEVMSCLKSKDAKELAEAERSFTRTSTGRFFPRYGDEFLPVSPAEAVLAGNFKNTEILAGANSNEGAFTFYYSLPEVYNTTEIPKITKEEAKQHIKRAFRTGTNPTPDEVANFYIDDIEEDDYESLVKAVFDSVSDARVVCPTLFFAEAYAEAGNPVYFYWFDHHPSTSPLPTWMGMAHTEDIQFVFGHPLRKPNEYTADEKVLSLSVIDKWSNFGESGDPNDFVHGYWPRYLTSDPAYLVLKSHGSEIGHGPHLETCKFWRKYYLLSEQQATE